MSELDELKTAVINGKRKDVLRLVPELLAQEIAHPYIQWRFGTDL